MLKKKNKKNSHFYPTYRHYENRKSSPSERERQGQYSKNRKPFSKGSYYLSGSSLKEFQKGKFNKKKGKFYLKDEEEYFKEIIDVNKETFEEIDAKLPEAEIPLSRKSSHTLSSTNDEGSNSNSISTRSASEQTDNLTTSQMQEKNLNFAPLKKYDFKNEPFNKYSSVKQNMNLYKIFVKSQTNLSNENTEILAINLKGKNNKNCVFKLRRFDDLFQTVKLFCEINGIEEVFIKPIILKVLETLNQIYFFMNSDVDQSQKSIFSAIRSGI